MIGCNQIFASLFTIVLFRCLVLFCKSQNKVDTFDYTKKMLKQLHIRYKVFVCQSNAKLDLLTSDYKRIA